MKDFIDLPTGEKKAQLGSRVPESLKKKAEVIAKKRNLTLSDLVITGLKGVIQKDSFDEIISISQAIVDLKKGENLSSNIINLISQTRWDRPIFNYFEEAYVPNPLFVAARMNNRKVFELLLDNKRLVKTDHNPRETATVNNSLYHINYTGYEGRSFFQSIALVNFPFALILRDKFKVRLNHVDNNGNNIIHQIIESKCLEDHMVYEENGGRYPEIENNAVENLKYLFSIKMNLKKDIYPININYQNINGDTPLLYLLAWILEYGENDSLVELLDLIFNYNNPDLSLNIRLSNHKGLSLKHYIGEFKLYPKRYAKVLKILKQGII